MDIDTRAPFPCDVSELLRDASERSQSPSLRPRLALPGLLGPSRFVRCRCLEVMTTALDVSAVVAYSIEAYQLSSKGRCARCAEKWGKAAEAAKQLGAPDCLVVANTQARYLLS